VRLQKPVADLKIKETVDRHPPSELPDVLKSQLQSTWACAKTDAERQRKTILPREMLKRMSNGLIDVLFVRISCLFLHKSMTNNLNFPPENLGKIR